MFLYEVRNNNKKKLYLTYNIEKSLHPPKEKN